MTLRLSFATALTVVMFGLAGCSADAPTGPSVTASDTGAPTAKPTVADASPGAFDLEEVQAVLDALPASAPFEWTGGTALSYPAQAQAGWDDTTSNPLACAPFYNLALLQFRDDREVAPSDVVVTKALGNAAGAGGDDDQVLATVSVRLLDAPSRGVGDGIDALAGVADACAGGFVVTDNALGWEMENVSKFEPLALPASLPAGVSALAFTADTAGGFTTPQTVWAWVARDNVLVAVNYYVDPDIGQASVDDAQALIETVIAGFGPGDAG